MGIELELDRVLYFAEPKDFRAWLEQHHATAAEQWVGFYKRASGVPSITWPESVDQALCYGWIDGIRRSIDGDRYAIRFTPRRPGSIWSAVNIRRAQELVAARQMRPAGRAAFDARDEAKSKQYSFEQKNVSFTREQERTLRSNRKAWEFFQAQPPSYRKTATWWVVSAKQEATRQKRMATLIADSAAGLRIRQLRREKS